MQVRSRSLLRSRFAQTSELSSAKWCHAANSLWRLVRNTLIDDRAAKLFLTPVVAKWRVRGRPVSYPGRHLDVSRGWRNIHDGHSRRGATGCSSRSFTHTVVAIKCE